MTARPWILLVTVALAGSTGCYYQPEHKRAKANPSYLSEAEAEGLITKRLARYGIKFITNMKLEREGASFVADGYDRDLRVGFEYRSHEGRDFEDQAGGNKDGLTEAEIEQLRGRQDTFREFFLIVPEGPPEQVEEAVDRFVKNLYAWEVLKKKEKTKSEELFPEQNKKKRDLLPWEATGDLKKKREEMERREAERKARGEDNDDEAWQQEQSGKQAGGASASPDDPFADDEPVEKPEKKSPKQVKKADSPKKTKPDDDIWGDEDEDF